MSGEVVCFVGGSILRGSRLVRRDLWIRDGFIIHPQDADWRADRTVVVKNRIISPGLIDLKLNGAYGVDFSDVTISEEDVLLVRRRLLEHGITTFLPTINASSQSVYRSLLPKVMKNWNEGAAPLGAHADGPFLNPYQSDATHCEDHIIGFDGSFFSRTPSGSHFDIQKKTIRMSFVRTDTMISSELDEDHRVEVVLRATFGRDYPNTLRIVSLAPELPYGMEAVAALRSQGILVAISHSRATFEEGLGALHAGATLVTHLFNGMPNFSHRAPGLVGLMASSDIPTLTYFGLIADLTHTHPEALITAQRLIAEDKLILLSDAVAPACQRGTAWKLRGKLVKLRRGRLLRVPKGGNINHDNVYGSITMLDECVRRFENVSDASPAQALQAASENPAKMLGVYPNLGALKPGSRADMVVWSDKLEQIATYKGGSQVWLREGYNSEQLDDSLVIVN